MISIIYLCDFLKQSKEEMKLIIINGPDLNLTGSSAETIHGKAFLEDYFKKLQQDYSTIEMEYFQSNNEQEIVDKIYTAAFTTDGIILNVGKFTFTSEAIADAILAASAKTIEVRFFNFSLNGDENKKNLIAPYCEGTISGFGLDSYRLAIESF